MKALFVSPAGAAYGSERSMLALLRARQFQAEVVCPGGGALERELRQLGVKVHPMEFGKYSLRQNPLWHLGFYRRFRRILKVSKPDVVVINLDGNTPLVTLAAVRAGIPIIRFSRFEFKAPTRWLDRWCWLKARAIICPSELVKQQVLAWIPPELHSRIHRFYDSYAGCATTPQEAAAFRQEFHLGDDKIIGCVGRLHRGKRIETAIEALAEVRKQVGNARLLIIGGDGSPDETAYKGELQQLATDLGVREDIAFTGYRSAEGMPAAIASLNVCVLPSESESFGMVLMEAWAQGVPTVASNVGGCCEISQASGGGYLAPVNDAGAFAGHLLALLTNPEIATAMGHRGKAWVDQNCAPADYSAEFQSIINACKSDTQSHLAFKIQSVTSNRAMLSAYARWVGSKLLSGKPPMLSLPGGTRIGEWLSFSEYWNFQNMMPEPERLFVERCLATKAGGRGTAFDVGANVGVFTCLMASHGHTVHSFEPVPETFCRLKNNVKFNGLLDRTHLNCLAVGKEQGLVTFHIQENEAATNRMALPNESSTNNASSTQLVAAISLDGYCKEQGIQSIDFIKVDVEGMEPYVLQGAHTLLKERKIAAMLIEICPVNLRSVRLSPADLYREFETARYSPYALNDDGRPGVKLSLADIEAMSLANVVLLPDA